MEAKSYSSMLAECHTQVDGSTDLYTTSMCSSMHFFDETGLWTQMESWRQLALPLSGSKFFFFFNYYCLIFDVSTEFQNYYFRTIYCFTPISKNRITCECYRCLWNYIKRMNEIFELILSNKASNTVKDRGSLFFFFFLFPSTDQTFHIITRSGFTPPYHLDISKITVTPQTSLASM